MKNKCYSYASRLRQVAGSSGARSEVEEHDAEYGTFGAIVHGDPAVGQPGSSLGGPRWTMRVIKELGLETTLRPQGRPKKQS